MEEVSLFVAFGAGVLSFFSPCVLPLVPVYLASVCGPEILETKTKRSRFPIFFHSLSFVVGFAIVFVGLGAAAGRVRHRLPLDNTEDSRGLAHRLRLIPAGVGQIPLA